MNTVESVSVKGLAFRVLQEIASRRAQAPACPVLNSQEGQHAGRPDSSRVESDSTAQIASCGSPDCGGCYDVGDGRNIHPPKIGQNYRRWLERWTPKGAVQ